MNDRDSLNIRRWLARNPVCASEGAAAAGAAAARPSPFAALLAGHVLRDGEVIILLLRPSRWFIVLSSLRFLAIVAILMIAGVIFFQRLQIDSRQIVEAGAFVMAGRLMWAVMQWMSRLYILTDLRILRLSGVFSVEIFDCPLRKVARTLLDRTLAERIFRIGSIIVIPQDENYPIGSWQMVARPREVHEQILASISRAKQGGAGCAP